MKRKFINPEIKDVATFTQFACESDGKLTEIEIVLQVGGGNPLHYHKTYSETFVAVDGELGLKLGENESKILKPGERFTVKLSRPEKIELDGDEFGETVAIRTWIEPGALTIRVPVEAAG